MDVLSCGTYQQTEQNQDINRISSSNIQQILQGASILAGGGGGDFNDALRRYREVGAGTVEVRDLQDFDENATLVTVYGLGPLDSCTEEPLEVAESSFRQFESHFSQADGIVLGELGPHLVVEAVVIADLLDLPVVNADVGGMRAVPSIQNEIVEGSSLDRAPLVCTDGSQTRIIEEELSGLELERRIRGLASENVWYVTGYPGSPEEYQAAAEGWFGECLNPLGGRANFQVLGGGTIENVEVRSIDGHTVGRVRVEGRETYHVFFRNENLLVLQNGEPIAEAPDIITLMTENGVGAYNGDIPEEGTGVSIYRIRYPDIWDNQAREIFNLEVGFDISGGEVSIGSEAFEARDAIGFTKTNSLGNDFVVIDSRDCYIQASEVRGITPELCERRFGIGANDVLLIQESSMADIRMRVFEPDGSEADMCGNGIRCVAHYMRGEGHDFPLQVETEAGVLEIDTEGEDFVVDMGAPDFERQSFTSSQSRETLSAHMSFEGREFEISGANTGEPHLVVFVDDVGSIDVEYWGEIIRNSRLAPEDGVNVNFVEIISESEIRVRTYERGVEEETLACGTGSTASAAVTRRERDLEDSITVEAEGGRLEIRFRDNSAFLVGDAQTVYTGELNLGDTE